MSCKGWVLRFSFDTCHTVGVASQPLALWDKTSALRPLAAATGSATARTAAWAGTGS